MAEEIERLLVRIEANAEHFEKSLRKMSGELRKSQKGTNDTLRQIESDVRRQSARMFTPMGDALRREVIRMGGIAAAGFSAKQIIDYADSYTNLQNRLKAAGLEGERLARVEAELFEAANKNGVAVDAVAKMYQRVSQSRAQLGASEQELMVLTNGVTAALRVQGVSAAEASGPLLQLGQALGAGTVRAEELNSLLEGTPLILQAAANGSDKFAGDMQKLAKAIRDGEVSSKELFAGLLRGLPDLERQAAALPQTVGQALQTLSNELMRYIGQTDASLGASKRLAQALEALAGNIDLVVSVGTTLAAVIGVRYAYAMGAAAVSTAAATASNIAYQVALIRLQARQTGATAAQVALNAAMAANPMGLVVTVVAGLVAGLVLLNRHVSEAARLTRELNAQSQQTAKAFGEYEDAARKAADATGEAKKAADALVESKKAAYVEAMRHAQALAHETMQIAAQRAQLAKLAAEQALRGGPKSEGEAIGQLAYAGAMEQSAAAAQAVADRANQEYIDAMQDYADLQERIKNGFKVDIPDSPTEKKKGKRDTGPTPEELAARRQILSLQMEIEAAQARGDKEAERSARARLDTLQLTKQLTDAQMADAAQVARDHVQMLVDAEEAADRLEVQAREKAKREEQAKKRREQERDVLMDTLEVEAELARLRGDPAAMEAAERRLFVEQRINELLAQREGLTRKEASTIANREWNDYSDADREGAMRDEFRRSFRDGIKAALDGDVGGFFESMADRFTDRMLDNLADNLFNILSDAMKGMNNGSGGGFWSSLFGAFSGGFGGGRATGGPVTAGRLYRINENTPNSEYFMPGTNGTVLTSGQVRGLQLGAGGAGAVVQNLQFDMRGAVMTEDLLREMDAKANAARLGAVAQVAAVSSEQQRKARFRTRG